MVPKLLPTVPVQRHVFPAAFFHVAVAVEPTLRQVIARFSKRLDSMGEASVRAAAAKRVKIMDFILSIQVAECVNFGMDCNSQVSVQDVTM